MGGNQNVEEQNEMISILRCTTFERKGFSLKAPALLEFFPERRLEHFLYIPESFIAASVLPRVARCASALVFFFGFAFEKPGEELLDLIFSHCD